MLGTQAVGLLPESDRMVSHSSRVHMHCSTHNLNTLVQQDTIIDAKLRWTVRHLSVWECRLLAAEAKVAKKEAALEEAMATLEEATATMVRHMRSLTHQPL
jgi:hypothetical protein